MLSSTTQRTSQSQMSLTCCTSNGAPNASACPMLDDHVVFAQNHIELRQKTLSQQGLCVVLCKQASAHTHLHGRHGARQHRHPPQHPSLAWAVDFTIHPKMPVWVICQIVFCVNANPTAAQDPHPTKVPMEVFPGAWAPIVMATPEGLARGVIDSQKGDSPDHEALWAMFWLIPHWANETKICRSTYNARFEAVADKPSFKTVWPDHQHCLVLPR